MKVFAIAGDPGGAQAVMAVVQELRKQQETVVTAGYNAAAYIFAPADHVFEEATTLDDAVHLLKKIRPDALLCGTSVNGRDDEKTFINAARQLGMPSIAVLDFWSNYAARFTTRPPDGPFDALPDVIAVMDECAADDLRGIGIDAQSIHITGQPAFDRLHAEAPPMSKLAELRVQIGCPSERHLILFASQPCSEIATKAGYAVLPYDERDIVQTFCEEFLAHPAANELFLWIRPHPREMSGKFRQHASPSVFAGMAGDSALAQHAAEGVAGMCSVFLLEAALIGKPVLSLQPGETGPSPLPLDRLRIGTACIDKDIRPAIRHWLDQWRGIARVDIPPAGGALRTPDASRHVVEELRHLAQR
ncbi:hypothetical protein [Prosthecobacter sp.]|jgi:hypothetical protein|uniref:hypothetical protein n=1 Tax=Prosthecobacter sp. TaxID=1965333 RepID=UPI003783297B